MSKVAEMLKHQQERHCFIKMDTEATQPLKIPFVRDYSQSEQYLLEYEKAVYEEQGAVSGSEVDLLLEENENRFLAGAGSLTLPNQQPNVIDVETAPAIRAEKRPGTRRSSARSQLFSKLKVKEVLNDD